LISDLQTGAIIGQTLHVYPDIPIFRYQNDDHRICMGDTKSESAGKFWLRDFRATVSVRSEFPAGRLHSNVTRKKASNHSSSQQAGVPVFGKVVPINFFSLVFAQDIPVTV
jgi:hypothetical protein